MVATSTATAPKKSPRPRKSTTTGATTAPKSRKKTPMTDEHKASLASGRDQARTVAAYLEALETHKPRRGRKVTVESLQKQLDKIEADLLTAKPLERLNLLQQKKDIQTRMAGLENPAENNIEELQANFVKVAREYAARRKIHRSTFVDVGVPATVLKEAGF